MARLICSLKTILLTPLALASVASIAGCATLGTWEDLTPASVASGDIVANLDVQLAMSFGAVDQSVIVTDSAGFLSLLIAIERRKYPVETIVVIGPMQTYRRTTRAPELKTVVSIQGTQDRWPARTQASLKTINGRPIEFLTIALAGRKTPSLTGRPGKYAGYLPQWGDAGYTGDSRVDAFLRKLHVALTRGATKEDLLNNPDLGIFLDENRHVAQL